MKDEAGQGMSWSHGYTISIPSRGLWGVIGRGEGGHGRWKVAGTAIKHIEGLKSLAESQAEVSGKEEQQPVVSVKEEVESDVEDEARMHI